MTSVFAVVCSVSPDLHRTKFFATLEGARKHLKTVADERRFRLGVDVVDYTPYKFAYLLGWEEKSVAYSIMELQVEE